MLANNILPRMLMKHPRPIVERLKKHTLLAGLLIMLPANAQCQNAPPALKGKSIIIAWMENRTQRNANQVAFRDVNFPFSMKIYVSTAGRPFSSLTVTPGRGASGSSEAVGASVTQPQGGQRQITFKGNTMVMVQSTFGGLARRFTVDFNESFATCSAQVIFAKQTGTQIGTARNLVTGDRIEIRSASIAGVSCSVRDGNVFGE